jgi:glutaredoxin
MTKADITVYGEHWCPDCRRSKQFLGEHQIPYNWTDIEEDTSGEKFVIEKNNGKRIIGLVPNTGFLEGSNISLDQLGFIVTGHALLHGDHRPASFNNRDPFLLETSVPASLLPVTFAIPAPNRL